MRKWVIFNYVEEFNPLLKFSIDDFTPSGNLCHYKENADVEVKLFPVTPMIDIFSLRWYIQHLMDETDVDDNEFENPVSQDNWMLQIRKKYMKYTIFHGHSIPNQHVNKIHIKTNTKTKT